MKSERDENSPLVPGGKIEFLLLEEQSPLVWEGLFKGSAKAREGLPFEIPFGADLEKSIRGKIIRGASDSPHGTVVAELDQDPISVGAGLVPLPPYIRRSHLSQSQKGDEEAYQTIYSKTFGSAAAPTAGLHFTPGVMNSLREKGVDWGEVTLHVGLGTFRPVKVDDIREHEMHEERFEISDPSAEAINSAKKQGRRVGRCGNHFSADA